MVIVSKKNAFNYPLRVRFRGEYNYDGLMALIRNFYKRSLFILHEPKLKYKTGDTGTEVEFKFTSDRKVTHYIKIFLTVTGHFWDVKRKESGLTDGKAEITINGVFQYNYASSLNSQFGFHKNKSIEYWMQSKLDSLGTGLQFGDNKLTGEKYLQKIAKQLQKDIKKYLKMECV